MATTYYNDIQKLYVAYFNRPGDPTGLAFWEKAVEASNGSTAVVAAEFAKQVEYTTAFSGKTNEQIVDQVYQNLFGRSSSGDTGADFWVKGLTAGTITVADVVTAVAAGAQGSDGTAFNNKVKAAALFTAALDTAAEKAGYAGAEANAVAKAWLAGITTDVSFAAATTPTKLNTTVAESVAAGTTFSVAGALASMDAAQTAIDKFVATIDTNGDGKTSDTKVGDIGTAYTEAVNNVAAKLGADVQTLFKASTTTDVVRDALISAQQASLASTLTTDQGKLADANTAISKVAGLSAAVSTLTSAQTAETTATKAVTAANADVAAKEAGFQITNAGTLTRTAADADGNSTLVLDKATGTDPVLATISASGKVTISADITASNYAGLTDLIAAYNTQLTATTAASKAHDVTVAAQAEVNHLDVDSVTHYAPGGVDSGKTEAQFLADVTASINAYATAHANTVTAISAGSTATEAQITTALKVMQTNDATVGTTEYENFNTLVTTYRAAAAATNPLTAELTKQTDAVKADNTAISDLAKLVAKLDVAEQNVHTLEGLQATLTASQGLLETKGYHVVDLDASTIGTSASDIFSFASLEAGADVTVSLFNLQGADSVFVGSAYKLVQGEIGATGVTGDNSALEVFVSSNTSGDAVLQIETSTFGSSASTPEVITITLTGVDATALHLNSGIISTGTVA